MIENISIDPVAPTAEPMPLADIQAGEVTSTGTEGFTPEQSTDFSPQAAAKFKPYEPKPVEMPTGFQPVQQVEQTQAVMDTSDYDAKVGSYIAEDEGYSAKLPMNVPSAKSGITIAGIDLMAADATDEELVQILSPYVDGPTLKMLVANRNLTGPAARRFIQANNLKVDLTDEDVKEIPSHFYTKYAAKVESHLGTDNYNKLDEEVKARLTALTWLNTGPKSMAVLKEAIEKDTPEAWEVAAKMYDNYWPKQNAHNRQRSQKVADAIRQYAVSQVGPEQPVQEPVQSSAQDSVQEPKLEKLEDGFYTQEDGTTVRVEKGRMYDVKTGAILGEPTPERGPDVGTIEANPEGMSQMMNIGGDVQDNLAGSGNADLEGIKTGVKELTGANLFTNVSEAIANGDELGAATEIGFELLGPFGDMAKSMFIGIKSAYARSPVGKRSLSKAIEMFGELINKAPDDKQLSEGLEAIRKKTGWDAAPDGNWNYEIDDSWATMDVNKLPINDRTSTPPVAMKGMKLDKVIEHQELFDNYPQLKDVTIVRASDNNEYMKGSRGFAQRSSGTIAINSKLTDTEAKGVILHETQHMIQGIEDWTTGSSLKRFLDEPAQRAIAEGQQATQDLVKSMNMDAEEFAPIFSTMVARAIRGGRNDLMDLVDELRMDNLVQASGLDYKVQKALNFAEFFKRQGVDKTFIEYGEVIEAHYIPAAQRYYRTYGEIQARTTQKSTNLTDFERRQQSPVSREDIPRNRAVGKDGELLQ